ncbi:MAG: HAD family hydrolase [Patescibacteria group bacterium]
MIKAVIFDYDGVIVDSFASVFEAYKVICERFKVDCPENLEEFRKTFGPKHHLNLGISDDDFPEVKEIYRKEMMSREHGLFPGITEVIEKLSKKYQLFLISSSHLEEIKSKLQKFDLLKYFAKISCGANLEMSKSGMMTELLLVEDCSPEEVISIGDRVSDCEAAQKVNIPNKNIILVTYGWDLIDSEITDINIANTPQEILKYIN